MVSFSRKEDLLLPPKLCRLQNLQTEIFRQLQLLIPDQVAHYDSFQSRVPGSPLLRMDILERHPYTHFLRLTYEFKKNEEKEIAPDAHIRLYNDARLAEVTSFNPAQGFTRKAHPSYPSQQLFQLCWRQNQALDKWLSYLLHQGHSITTMQPTDDRISGKQVIPIKESVRSL
jgi:uncharacterized protein YqiB (DUF1249 family)